MYIWLYGILGSGENYPELALIAAPRARSRCVPLPLLTIAPALPERQWYWCQGAAAAALRASGALCPGWGEFAGIWHHVECTEHGEMLKLGHQLAALCLACSFLPCVETTDAAVCGPGLGGEGAERRGMLQASVTCWLLFVVSCCYSCLNVKLPLSLNSCWFSHSRSFSRLVLCGH